MNDQVDTPTEDRRRRRKLLAIASGGLVLGIGAAVTLAAWTDMEAATGDFQAGAFGLESSADGETYVDTTPPANALSLSFGAISANLAPRDSASAVYAVKLTDDSTYAAAVAGAVEASGTAADNLTYTIQRVSDIGGGTAVGTPLISGEAVTSGAVHEGLFTLDAVDEPVFLKVTVTADGVLGQGESADITWNLTGTSGDAL